MKKEQGKCEKGAKGEKLKGAGSKRGNCKRSREHGPPLTEAQRYALERYAIESLPDPLFRKQLFKGIGRNKNLGLTNISENTDVVLKHYLKTFSRGVFSLAGVWVYWDR